MNSSIKNKALSPILSYLGVLLLVVIGGCVSSEIGERFVKRVGSKSLFEFARDFETNHVGKLREGTFPDELWPPTFRDSGVVRIQPYFDGVQLVLKITNDAEYGVYVTAADSENPDSGSGISFKELEPGIFWFEEKVRKLSKRAQDKLRQSEP